MNRRQFLAGLTASAAGLLLPERRVWALDRTMLAPRHPQWWYDVQAMGQDWAGSTWFDFGVTRYEKIPVIHHIPFEGWHVDPADAVLGVGTRVFLGYDSSCDDIVVIKSVDRHGVTVGRLYE